MTEPINQQPRQPPRRPIALSSLFTPPEWIASVTTWEADRLSESPPSALTVDTMADSLLYGARRLTDLGYRFTGFDFEPDEDDNRHLVVKTAEPLGAAAGLVGLHPTRLARAAHDFLVREVPPSPERDELVDKVKVVVEKRREQFGEDPGGH